MKKKVGCSAFAALAAVLLSGCATSPDAAPSTRAQATAGRGDQSAEGDTSAAAAALRQAVSEAVDDRSAWGSLHLLVECAGDAGMRSAEVYGNGVGIWDHRRQFTLTPVEISSLLRTLDGSGFARFAEVYGGRKPPDPRPQEERPGAGGALQVICRVGLSLAGLTKQVVQLRRGDQSAELRQLADDLLATCEKPGRAGTAAADLADGLEMVARGELAPETFHVLLNRKPEAASAGPAGGGYLLRLAGLRATSRVQDPATGLQEPLSLTLSRAEVAALARELTAGNLADLPINLYAPGYTDLSVEVLNHEKSVQARRFAGMSPEANGERRLDFERIYDALERLHLRVLSEGEPAAETGG